MATVTPLTPPAPSAPVAPLKVAIMSFAHTHALGYAAALREMPGVEVRVSDPAVPDVLVPGEVRGRALADALGVDYAETYDDLLAWGPDAVIVTSENARHRELVELAAGAGAAILCEKPLATSWEDGLAMRAAVEKAGVPFMMAFPVRFAGTFDRLRAAHEGGALGEVFAIRGSNNGMLPLARSWFTEPELSGGGALVDHVVHIADLLDALRGVPVASVTAVANTKLHAARARAETAGLVTLTYADGVVAAIDCSWSQPDTSPIWGGLKLSVAGSAGTVDIDFFGPAARGLDARTGAAIVRTYGPNFDEAMLDVFLSAVRAGEQPQPDLAVGLRTLGVVLAAQESVRTGRTVEVVAP
ncbi:putative oxidoreductase YcjS [Frondihabitans sp. 762G35]|uniref:Gfo/Idh/MocA family protein n=1 Tax=Frondihabitans sp. 762G35 TaxID=1446794 RepID=UPI000D210308|nr:Gfo/Idh/MocA family oxidoreductase [Frondihabitans sp. 762G35]ARC56264.1 putative oxidoreductase YcjS [Frondihabitans sp. 762G35]